MRRASTKETPRLDGVQVGKKKLRKRKYRQARKLIDLKKYADARALIGDTERLGHHEAKRLQLLAEICSAEEKYEESAELYGLAYEQDATGIKGAAEYIGALGLCRSFREALVVYGQLSPTKKQKRNIRWEMYWLYRWMGLRSYADFAARSEGQYAPKMEHIHIFLRRLMRPILLKVERRQVRAIEQSCKSIKVLKSLHLYRVEYRHSLAAEVDSVVIGITRVREWSLYLRNLADVALVVLSSVCFALWLLLPVGLGLSLQAAVVAFVLAAVEFYLASKVWNALPTYQSAALAVGVFCAIGASGGILAGQTLGSSFLAESISAGLTAGAIIAIAGMFGSLAAAALETYLIQRVVRSRVRGAILHNLSELILWVSDGVDRFESGDRKFWIGRIETTARLLEVDMPRFMSARDERTDGWFKEQCGGAARHMRNLKLSIISPDGSSWERLERSLRHQLAAAAAGNWCSLARKFPAVSLPPQRKRDVVTKWARGLIVTFLPVVAVLALGPWLSLESDLLKWSRVVAVAWALLSIIFALDPGLRDKVDAMKNVAGILRESGEKSKPETHEIKASQSATS